MKNKYLILGLIALFITSNQAFAELTTSDTVDPEYLETKGHSEAMIEATQYCKSRANGEKYTPKRRIPLYDKAPIKQIRYFFMNVDPAYDDESFNNHDIKMYPHWRDY